MDNATGSHMDRPIDCHTEGRKLDRARQISWDITYMWNLKRVQINLQNRNTATDVENKLSVSGGKLGRRAGINWD